MKSTRRLLSIILCLVMCLSLLPTAFAEDGLVSSGKAGTESTFKLFQDGRLIISGSGIVVSMEQWSFDDPNYVWDQDDVLQTQTVTKTLIVEEGIEVIGIEAFKDCPNMTSVSLPTSLTGIWGYAFQNCSGLTEISIPGNVTWIRKGAFQGCTSLKTVNLSTGLNRIGESAFEDCTSLQSIMIPANVNQIDAFAFRNCGSLGIITFQCNFHKAFGMTPALINQDAFVGVEAFAYYPADNNTWNSTTDGLKTDTPAYPDYGGRLTWRAASGQTSSEGWVKKGTDANPEWYYYVNGQMIQSNWKAYGGKWYYFGADGKMVTGRQQIDGKYYYFGQGAPKDAYSLGARVSGLVTDPDDGKLYFYDENGVWQPSYSGVDDNGLDYMTNGWQQSNDGKWFYIRNKAKVTGWLYSNGYWYYLDPITGAMVTGWLTWKGHTYYLRPLDKAIADGLPDREGSMIAGRSATIGNTVYSFDASGALIGGKMEDNPGGLQNGFRNEGTTAKPDWKFYRSDGTMARGWELVDSNWYYFDTSTGKMQTGWKKIGGVWYYLTKWAYSGTGDEDKSENWVEITDPTDTSNAPYFAGRMVTGFNKIPYTKSGVNTVRTYYFKNNGALNGRGWIKVGLRWYFLETDGVVVTGWFRDNTKWYFLDPGTSPIGEMVTGYVEKTADGSYMKDPGGTVGGQSFAASGEWLGAGVSALANKAGKWAKHGDYWYYYNADGDDYKDGNNNAVTGWQLINGKWYYLSPSGSTDPKNPPLVGYMYTGWQDIDGERYYFDPVNGDAKGGFQKIDGVWYYMYPVHDGGYGKMLTGWHNINGKWYYLYDDPASPNYGALQDGWIKKPANENDSTEYWFYLEENEKSKTYGAMQEGGWKKIKDKWYYFHNEHDGYYGKLEQGEWINTNGKWYFVKPAVPDHPEESMMATGVYEVKSPAKWPGTYDFGTDGACKTPPTVKTGWNNNGGNWTYVNSDGSLATGEQNNLGGSGKDYFFDSNGIMQTGMQKVGGKLYYYDSDGAKMKKNGLQEVNGNTYLFDKTDGYAAQTGWQEISGKKYYFDENTGAMKKGLQTIGTDKYYFDDSGVMQTGWQTVNGEKYFFRTTSGTMVTGFDQNIDGKKYYFNDDGVMQIGWQEYSGKLYYFGTDGAKQELTGWQEIDGNKYWFNSGNYAEVGGPSNIDGKYYYFNEKGEMQTGVQHIGSDQYYFHDDGHMAINETIDGVTYGPDGKAT